MQELEFQMTAQLIRRRLQRVLGKIVVVTIDTAAHRIGG